MIQLLLFSVYCFKHFLNLFNRGVDGQDNAVAVEQENLGVVTADAGIIFELDQVDPGISVPLEGGTPLGIIIIFIGYAHNRKVLSERPKREIQGRNIQPIP